MSRRRRSGIALWCLEGCAGRVGAAVPMVQRCCVQRGANVQQLRAAGELGSTEWRSLQQRRSAGSCGGGAAVMGGAALDAWSRLQHLFSTARPSQSCGRGSSVVAVDHRQRCSWREWLPGPTSTATVCHCRPPPLLVTLVAHHTALRLQATSASLSLWTTTALARSWWS